MTGNSIFLCSVCTEGCVNDSEVESLVERSIMHAVANMPGRLLNIGAEVILHRVYFVIWQYYRWIKNIIFLVYYYFLLDLYLKKCRLRIDIATTRAVAWLSTLPVSAVSRSVAPEACLVYQVRSFLLNKGCDIFYVVERQYGNFFWKPLRQIAMWHK